MNAYKKNKLSCGIFFIFKMWYQGINYILSKFPRYPELLRYQ